MEWISVKERLPEGDEDVLVWVIEPGERLDQGYKTISSVNNAERNEWYAIRVTPGIVTHWMPLPDPPRESEHFLVHNDDITLAPEPTLEDMVAFCRKVDEKLNAMGAPDGDGVEFIVDRDTMGGIRAMAHSLVFHACPTRDIPEDVIYYKKAVFRVCAAQSPS